MTHLQVTVCLSDRPIMLSATRILIDAVLVTDLQPPIQRRQVQRGLLLAVSHGWVSQLLQQHRHHLSVSVLGGTVKSRLPLMVLQRGWWERGGHIRSTWLGQYIIPRAWQERRIASCSCEMETLSFHSPLIYSASLLFSRLEGAATPL